MMTKSLPALILAILLLAGCGIGGKSKPANFFVLNALPEDTQPVAESGINAPMVGVGQVKIPGFLDRPQIVTQVADNQIALSEFNRWGESIQIGITRILREDIALYLGSAEVSAFPWLQPFPNDYVAHVVVLSFEAAPYREEVSLRALYRITDSRQKELFLTKEVEVSSPLPPSADYAEIVDVMSLALGKLSKEIATDIAELPLPSAK